MDYQLLAEELVKKTMAQGADAAEVYIETGRDLNIEVRNGEVETMQESTSNGAGFRVFVKGRMAFASCNDFSQGALEEAMASAVRMAKVTTEDENNVLPDEKGFTQVEGLYDPEIAKVSMDKKIAMAMEVEKLAMLDHRITKSAGSGYFEGEGEIFLANSNGLVKSYKTGACSLGASVVAEKGNQ